MPDAIDAQAAWVLRVLGIVVSGADPVAGMEAWRSARSAALASLKALEGAFRAMDEPEVDSAVILLRAIASNLTERPKTRRQVDELRRYIETDDIIDDAEEPNGFGITVLLREPLLAALDQLHPAD